MSTDLKSDWVKEDSVWGEGGCGDSLCCYWGLDDSRINILDCSVYVLSWSNS